MKQEMDAVLLLDYFIFCSCSAPFSAIFCSLLSLLFFLPSLLRERESPHLLVYLFLSDKHTSSLSFEFCSVSKTQVLYASFENRVSCNFFSCSKHDAFTRHGYLVIYGFLAFILSLSLLHHIYFPSFHSRSTSFFRFSLCKPFEGLLSSNRK